MNHGGRILRFARERGLDFRQVTDFSANINPLGPSPRVLDAIRDALDLVRVYPHELAEPLVERISTALNVRRDWVLAGNGGTELLFFWLRVVRPRRALLFVPTFSEYRRALQGVGSEITVRALRSEDQFQLPRAVESDRVDAVIVTNPNNPSGAFMPPEEMAEWLAQFPRETSVFVDEAFIEFTLQPSITAHLGRFPNLWVLRSMTKFHAIPGIRAGCLLGSGVPALMAFREPWQMSALAANAAIAALDDLAHQEATAQLIQKERLWLWKQLWRIPAIEPFPTAANFYLARFRRAGDLDRLIESLLEDNILIRDCRGTEGLNGEYFRFAIRTRPENKRLLAHLEKL